MGGSHELIPGDKGGLYKQKALRSSLKHSIAQEGWGKGGWPPSQPQVGQVSAARCPGPEAPPLGLGISVVSLLCFTVGLCWCWQGLWEICQFFYFPPRCQIRRALTPANPSQKDSF